jgi:hypothetical protein
VEALGRRIAVERDVPAIMRDGRVLRAEYKPRRGAMSDGETMAVTNLAHTVGSDSSIEWGWDGEMVWLLQVRLGAR